jgi:prolyl 4-hydroxylase
MKHHQAIRPELRQWILDTTRAGHGVPEVLALMKQHGYDAASSRRMVAEVLKIPLMALTAIPARGLRPRHPQAPRVDAAGHPITISLSVEAPVIRLLQGILSVDECSELIALARPRLKRALTVSTDGGAEQHEARTGAGMFFALGENPLIERIEQRIAALLDLPVIHGEGLQVLHYQHGQEYQPHVDWFDPAQPGHARVTAQGGQRVASVVMYLNTPEAGGGTGFPALGLEVTAVQGSAVYFAYEEGDHGSLHAGLPVLRGEKWIATKWLRERPYRLPQPA